jgi:ferritin-like metal-binding protein YciE
MPKLADLHTVMIDNLRDLLSAEKQLVQALPKMAKGATTEELKTAFTDHLGQTKEHVSRLEQAFTELGVTPRAKHCKGMEGLLEEGKEVLEADGEGAAIDAGLISAAVRVEHYEIAAYGSVIAMAEQMGHTTVAEILRQTLEEEEAADELLTGIAEGGVNAEANGGAEGSMPEGEEVEDAEEGEEAESDAPPATRAKARGK